VMAEVKPKDEVMGVGGGNDDDDDEEN
jgi:hypothetical protein